MFRVLLAAVSVTLSAAAEPPAQPLLKGPFPVLVLDKAKNTSVTGIPGKDATAAEIARELTANPWADVMLSIDWLGQEPAPTAFTPAFDAARGIHTSTLNVGDAHITRTVLVTKEAIILHFLADKPGALSFRASIRPPKGIGGVAIEDRRELVWNGPDGRTKARAWIIPFESDVESDVSSIVLRGEGECLVLFTATAAEDPAAPIAETWRKLAAARDPGADPPDPTKVWQAILAAAGAP